MTVWERREQRQTEATERKGPSPRTEEKGAEVGRTGGQDETLED